MVATDNGPQSVFIAGYQDLTDEEFIQHYRKKLDETIENGNDFLISDEAGTCLKSFEYLLSKNVSTSRISIYTNEEDNQRTIQPSVNANIISVAGGDAERYAAMAERSDDCDIIWLRPGDGLDDHGCISAADAMDMRFTGAVEAMRAVTSKQMYIAMAYYDEIA